MVRMSQNEAALQKIIKRKEERAGTMKSVYFVTIYIKFFTGYKK
jgi:hypothetical protein